MVQTQQFPQAETPEIAPRFVPTPERLSQYLERNREEILTELASVDGRNKIYDQLVKHEDELRKIDPSFHPDLLREQLDLVGETLQSKERFLTDVQSPENKGFFGRAWEKIKSFPRNHPVVTSVLTIALIVGAVATGFYLTGNLEALLQYVGLGHLYGPAGASEAAKPIGNILAPGGAPTYQPGPTLPDSL